MVADDSNLALRATNSTNATTTTTPSSGFQMLPQYHSQARRMRVVMVGAGATGLCVAYKMERALENYELVCYEKNEEIGGTWLKNRYPGCACDVPAHIYTYTFEPNPKWKRYYATSPEIQDYFVNFTEKYGLRKYVKLNHRVLGATWHEDKSQWEVQIEHGGEKFVDWADVLINGSGTLDKWRWPDIEGLHSFKGELIHTGAWDQQADMTGKRVAVIGTGSSAIQMVPQAQKVASLVKSFMRGKTWIAPPMSRVMVDMPGRDASAVGAVDTSVGQYFYSDEEIAKLTNDPEYHLQYRRKIEGVMAESFAMFYKDTEASEGARAYMTAEMTRRLGGHPELTKRLIPSWAPGCRRLTPGDGYLEALVKPNVECVFGEITSIDETGLRTDDGAHHDVDMIVCATGYDMAWTPHFPLIGRNGVSIQEAWSPLPQSYLGIAAPGFPNYFVMNGPRANLANGTVLPSIETEVDYAVAAVKKMQEDRIKTFDVKQDVTDKLNEYIDAWQETSVFSLPCKSWYKNNTVNGKVMAWGGSSSHFVKTLKTPRWEHYNFEYVEDHPWAFLGNGRTKSEAKGEIEKMVAYIRNSDHPWNIE